MTKAEESARQSVGDVAIENPVINAAVYGELGVLRSTSDGSRVQCHACGEWFILLTNTHLEKHDLTADTYRERYGLNRLTGLASPNSGERRRRGAFDRNLASIALLKGCNPPRTVGHRWQRRTEAVIRGNSVAARTRRTESLRRWTDQEMIENLRGLRRELGRDLEPRDLTEARARRGDFPSRQAVLARFGSWLEVCAAVGQRWIQPRTRRLMGSAAMLAALCELENELGEPLTEGTVRRRGATSPMTPVPSADTIRARFGSWANVREALDRLRSSRGMAKIDTSDRPPREGRVRCLECGAEMKLVTPTHLREHGLSSPQYRARHPDVPHLFEPPRSGERRRRMGEARRLAHRRRIAEASHAVSGTGETIRDRE